jgi:RNA polymerase sigma-70 factor, ECF subfamily
MTERPDSRLVRSVVEGDRASFAPLVDRYQDRLYRRALAMLGDGDLAADMVQDAFVRAYTGLRDADPDRFGAWIHRILRNLCLDELRSPRTRAESLPLRLATTADPVRDLELGELRAALGRALDGLPPAIREAFVLKHVEGLSYQEMTDLTGASESALKMRVKRAREALQERLEPGRTDVACDAADA